MFNIDEDQTILQTPLMDIDQDRRTLSSVETRDNLNLIKGKNGPTAFLPLGPNLGENNKRKEVTKSNSVTMKPTDYIYRKVE